MNHIRGDYDAYAFDLFGHVAIRHRQLDIDVDSSEVTDSYGRIFERFNVQSAGPDPVTDPVASFGQFGNRTEEEDRAATNARYARSERNPATEARIYTSYPAVSDSMRSHQNVRTPTPTADPGLD